MTGGPPTGVNGRRSGRVQPLTARRTRITNRSSHISSVRPFVLAALCCGLALAPTAVSAQEEPVEEDAVQSQALRVFFDCQGPYCDFDFFRREIPFVNYTRDRTVAQVHLLVTSEGTGSGGRRFTLDFIGREDFEGIDDRLLVTSRANLASEQVLTQIANSVRLGLLRYVARTDQAANVRVIYEAPAGQESAAATAQDDPWNFWTFRVRGNANVDVDERTESFRFGGGVTASRITDELKLEFGIGGSYNESHFETSDTTTVTSIRESYEFEGFTVWSLSSHWSFGVSYEAAKSTFANYGFRTDIAPALEYNIYPYAESTRRQLSFVYMLGIRYNDYIDETVFLETSETLPAHSLSASLSIRQPWGGSFGFVEFSQFLHDLSKNRFNARVGADFRLFRGLSVGFNANYSRIRDQLNVPAGDATQEEVLLRQRVLQSGYEYGVSINFSYTFGSIFSNVVNPRLERF